MFKFIRETIEARKMYRAKVLEKQLFETGYADAAVTLLKEGRRRVTANSAWSWREDYINAGKSKAVQDFDSLVVKLTERKT